MVIYEPQKAKLVKAFESLPNTVAAALRNINPKPSITAVVERKQEGQALYSWPYPGMRVSLLINRKNVVLAEISFGMPDIGRINIPVTCAKVLISMTLSHLYKRKH